MSEGHSSGRPWPILALALACFAIGTTEFVIVGILPDVANDLDISLSAAGMLVTGYALGVAVGGPLVVWLTFQWPRKLMLLSMLGVFVVGNVLSAVAPNYWLLMTGRLVASLSHGSFFGVGAVVASQLVPAERRGAAIALMFSGLTLANVLGVPVGTLIGQWSGWRSTFVTVSLLGVAALAGLAALLPPGCKGDASGGSMSAIVRPGLLLALALTVFSFGGVFVAFTFIAPMLIDVAGLSPQSAAETLFLFGAGMTVGNAAGGRLADWRLLPSLAGILIALVCSELLLSLVLPSALLAVTLVFVWGFAAFCAVPGLQTNVVNEARGAAAFASTLNVSAFNIGNAAGAWVGSALLSAGVPLRWLPAFASISAVVGAALAALSIVAHRRRAIAPSTAPISLPLTGDHS